MAKVYVSPSLQVHNAYVSPPGGVEEEHMRAIGKIVAATLSARGVQVRISDRAWNGLADADYLNRLVAASNAFGANVHLALHSDAGPSSVQGSHSYYFRTSANGKKLAGIMAGKVAKVTPSGKSVIVPNTDFAEIHGPTAVSVLTELGFHTSPTDAKHIAAHPDLYARAIADAVCEFLGVKIVVPKPATVLVERLSPSMYVRLMRWLGKPARKPDGTTQVRILSTVWSKFMAAIRHKQA